MIYYPDSAMKKNKFSTAYEVGATVTQGTAVYTKVSDSNYTGDGQPFSVEVWKDADGALYDPSLATLSGSEFVMEPIA